MSFLLAKSQENYHAISFLIDKECFAPAVHCGYYSCIQKIVYILKEYFTKEYNLGIESLKGGHGGRHKFYIDELSGRFSKDRGERRRLKTLLLQLRDYRIEADYHDTEITKDKVNKAHDYVKEIQRLIKKNCDI